MIYEILDSIKLLLPSPGVFTKLSLSSLNIIESAANMECLKVFPSFDSPVFVILLPVLVSIIPTGAEWKPCQGFVLAPPFSFCFNLDFPLIINILETEFFLKNTSYFLPLMSILTAIIVDYSISQLAVFLHIFSYTDQKAKIVKQGFRENYS